jgi:hypothetical protein
MIFEPEYNIDRENTLANDAASILKAQFQGDSSLNAHNLDNYLDRWAMLQLENENIPNIISNGILLVEACRADNSGTSEVPRYFRRTYNNDKDSPLFQLLDYVLYYNLGRRILGEEDEAFHANQLVWELATLEDNPLTRPTDTRSIDGQISEIPIFYLNQTTFGTIVEYIFNGKIIILNSANNNVVTQTCNSIKTSEDGITRDSSFWAEPITQNHPRFTGQLVQLQESLRLANMLTQQSPFLYTNLKLAEMEDHEARQIIELLVIARLISKPQADRAVKDIKQIEEIKAYVKKLFDAEVNALGIDLGLPITKDVTLEKLITRILKNQVRLTPLLSPNFS